MTTKKILTILAAAAVIGFAGYMVLKPKKTRADGEEAGESSEEQPTEEQYSEEQPEGESSEEQPTEEQYSEQQPEGGYYEQQPTEEQYSEEQPTGEYSEQQPEGGYYEQQPIAEQYSEEQQAVSPNLQPPAWEPAKKMAITRPSQPQPLRPSEPTEWVEPKKMTAKPKKKVAVNVAKAIINPGAAIAKKMSTPPKTVVGKFLRPGAALQPKGKTVASKAIQQIQKISAPKNVLNPIKATKVAAQTTKKIGKAVGKLFKRKRR
jgi:hypothetical protein